MNNYEYYKEEIKEQANIDINSVCYFINRLKDGNFECENNCGFCFDAIVKWLNQEHKEPIKLTQTEYHILKGLEKEWKYIARNKDGVIVIHTTEAYKVNDSGLWDSYDRMWDIPYYHIFQFIKWEDEEPYSIEELLKCEVVGDE